jgi:hypothetical protein
MARTGSAPRAPRAQPSATSNPDLQPGPGRLGEVVPGAGGDEAGKPLDLGHGDPPRSTSASTTAPLCSLSLAP